MLPRANAMVARARDEQQLGSLLASEQAMLAVMRPRDAENLFRGGGVFTGLDGSGLRRLLDVDGRVLVAPAVFARHHAWLVSAALSQNAGTHAMKVSRAADGVVPVHAGALAFARGEPLPDDR